jgi:hypothetical protein
MNIGTENFENVVRAYEGYKITGVVAGYKTGGGWVVLKEQEIETAKDLKRYLRNIWDCGYTVVTLMLHKTGTIAHPDFKLVELLPELRS